jgi:hypothetical protein
MGLSRPALGFVLLVLVISAGCGGRLEAPDGVTAPALATDAGSADDREDIVTHSAPFDAGSDDAALGEDAGAPASRSCHCAEVTIACSSALGYASSDRAACALALPRGMCGTLGLSEGDAIDPLALLALARDRATAGSADDVYAFCAMKHEARHTCDAPTVRPCESEQSAYSVSLVCMSDLWSSSCASGQRSGWCQAVQRSIEAHSAARTFNACACAPDATCTSCTKQCSAAFTDLGGVCRDSARAYCKVNGK